MMRAIAPLALAALLAGCGGHASVQVNSGGAPAGGVSSGSTINIQGRSSLGTLLSIVLIAGVAYEGERDAPWSARAPEPDPSRRVVEHDCTKPIEDWSANLKCR
jgi:hypothetical protein